MSSLTGWLFTVAIYVIWIILHWKVFVAATPPLYLAAVLLPLGGFIFAFLLAKLACQVCPHYTAMSSYASPSSSSENLIQTCLFQNNEIGRTIGIETSSQNMPVALTIIILSFTESDVSISQHVCP